MLFGHTMSLQSSYQMKLRNRVEVCPKFLNGLSGNKLTLWLRTHVRRARSNLLSQPVCHEKEYGSIHCNDHFNLLMNETNTCFCTLHPARKNPQKYVKPEPGERQPGARVASGFLAFDQVPLPPNHGGQPCWPG